jgi:murein L,D-transpeptidase YcbB/YkuD
MLSAVKKFQKNHGLEVTGVVDKKTWDKLIMPPPVKRRAKK